MALSNAKVREILSDAGVVSDKMKDAVAAIIDGHTASIDALREERDTAKAEAARMKSENDRLTGELQKANAETDKVKADLKSAAEKAQSDAKTAAEAAKNDADKRVQAETDKLTAVQKELDELKAKHAAAQQSIADLTAAKTELETYKAEQEARVTMASKEDAFKAFLKDLNLSEKGISLAMKYTSMDAVELNDKGKISNAAALKKTVSEDWGDYIQEDIVKGAETATPPVNNPVAGKSAAEILTIQDDAELTRAIEANPAAFGLA